MPAPFYMACSEARTQLRTQKYSLRQHEELSQVLTKIISSSLALPGRVMIVIPCPPPVVPVHVGRLNCQTAADLSRES